MRSRLALTARHRLRLDLALPRIFRLKPAKFKYIAPNSSGEVVSHLASYNGEARCLSGGQSLLPLMNFRLIRPEALIDLNRCPGLDYLRRDDGQLVIGPMTTQSTVEYSDLVKTCCPLITKTMIYLGSPTIRNRGTIGGTLAHADRTAELPAVAVALEAELIAQSPMGIRRIAADDFFRGDLSTDLRTDEMLLEIRFPVSPAGSLSAFTEATNRHHDLALAGVAVHLELAEGGLVANARIVCNGIAPSPVRLKRVEQTLCGTRADDDAVRDAVQFSLEGVEPEGDIHASADYRSAVLPRLVARALQQAVADGPRLQ
jgi:CO/xanthine dehydrogenase FAD-binding subunit